MRFQKYRAEKLYWRAYAEQSDCSTRPWREEERQNAPLLGQLISTRRRALRIGLRRFAHAIQCSPTFVSLVETGKYPFSPRAATCHRIAEVLGIPLVEILRAAKRLPESLLDFICQDPHGFDLLQVMMRRGISAKTVLSVLPEALARMEEEKAGQVRPLHVKKLDRDPEAV